MESSTATTSTFITPVAHEVSLSVVSGHYLSGRRLISLLAQVATARKSVAQKKHALMVETRVGGRAARLRVPLLAPVAPSLDRIRRAVIFNWGCAFFIWSIDLNLQLESSLHPRLPHPSTRCSLKPLSTSISSLCPFSLQLAVESPPPSNKPCHVGTFP